MPVPDTFVEPHALRSENERHRFAIRNVPEAARRFGGKEHRAPETRQPRFDLVETFPHDRMDLRPVVEPRAAHARVVEREAERLHEMELRARGEARTPDVA